MVFVQSGFAADTISCSNKKIDIKAKGFTGFGAEAKKTKTIGYLSLDNSPDAIYQRSFEIGRYRFSREGSEWSIYRKNDDGVFELRKDVHFPVKISADQPLYVSQRDKNVLELRRNTDSANSISMTLVFGKETIEAKEQNGSPILTYNLCPSSTPKAATRATAAPNTKN